MLRRGLRRVRTKAQLLNSERTIGYREGMRMHRSVPLRCVCACSWVVESWFAGMASAAPAPIAGANMDFLTQAPLKDIENSLTPLLQTSHDTTHVIY